MAKDVQLNVPGGFTTIDPPPEDTGPAVACGLTVPENALSVSPPPLFNRFPPAAKSDAKGIGQSPIIEARTIAARATRATVPPEN